MANRCTDPNVGVNVLSYDLLVGDEKEQLEAHLKECKACSGLVDQAFGDEGALQDIDMRAWQLTRRRPVAPHEWLLRRVASLWIPLLLVFVGAGAFLFYLARRSPEPERVEIVRLAATREAEIDSLTRVVVPRISQALTSLIVHPDRDAIVLVYESGDGYLRRLIPGADADISELRGSEAHELMIPDLDRADAHVLLVLAPVSAPRFVDAWDRAVWLNLGGEARDGEQRGWPEGVAATLRWVR